MKDIATVITIPIRWTGHHFVTKKRKMLLGAGESLPKSKYCCLHVITVRSGTAVIDFLISVRG